MNGVPVGVVGEAAEVSIARIEVKLDQALVDLAKLANDHEARLRALEKWRYTMPAGIGILANLMTEWLKTMAGS